MDKRASIKHYFKEFPKWALWTAIAGFLLAAFAIK
jgi:hypothetical protein